MYVYIHTRTTIVSEWPTEFPDVHPAMVEMSLLMLGGLQRSRNASTKRPNIWTSHWALLTNRCLGIFKFVFRGWTLEKYANFACHFKLYSLGLWYFWKIWIFSFQLMYLRMQNLRVINQKLNLWTFQQKKWHIKLTFEGLPIVTGKIYILF